MIQRHLLEKFIKIVGGILQVLEFVIESILKHIDSSAWALKMVNLNALENDETYCAVGGPKFTSALIRNFI